MRSDQTGLGDRGSRMPSFPPPRVVSRRTHLPIFSLLRRKVFRLPDRPLEAVAEKTWQIAPGVVHTSRPAFYLDNQLERVTGWIYMDDPRLEMPGGRQSQERATTASLIKDAWLVDGTIYKSPGAHRLLPRSRRVPRISVAHEIERGALTGTWDGLGFFGLWLTDDCALYPLAAVEGIPFTTGKAPSPHMRDYESWLEMTLLRVSSAFVRELVVFGDTDHNLDKGRRFAAMREKLLRQVPAHEPHPGVFILRRDSGKRRILEDEMALAERLRQTRGFRIVDVTTQDLPSIAASCAGAKVVAGVEGSHLMHGLMWLGRGGSVLTVQPPDRFCSVIKRTMDRDDQHFAFVVGRPTAQGFRADFDEVERTLDLLPSS